MSEYKEITSDEVFALYQLTGAVHLIDVREENEFAAVSASISTNLPLSQLTDPTVIDKLGIGKDEAIYLICRSGKRSATACEIFAQKGYQRLYNVTGGMLAWQAGLLPLR